LTTIARDLGVTARHVAESVLKRLDGRTTPSRGSTPPDDLAVIGVDDISAAAFAAPPSAAARALRKGRSDIVLCVLPGYSP